MAQLPSLPKHPEPGDPRLAADLLSNDEALRAAVNTIDNSQIVDGTIYGAKIVPGTIGGDRIGAGAVQTGNLDDLAVTTAKIADDAITSAKIADGTIATGDLADGAVSSAKIATGAITGGVIPTDGIVTAQIAHEPYARVYRNSNVDLISPWNTNAIVWDTAQSDPDGMWNGTQLLIAPKAGQYLITGRATVLSQNAASAPQMHLFWNGVEHERTRVSGGFASGQVEDLSITSVLNLQQGHYVELRISPGNNTRILGGLFYTNFAAKFIGK